MKARVAVLFLLIVLAALGWNYQRELIWILHRIPIIRRFFKPTVEQQINIYGAQARERLSEIFSRKHIAYPPDKVAFIAIKSSKELLVYATTEGISPAYICTYPILGASGHLGPKLRSGDLQVPEGIYRLSLEPDTPYHLALRLNYPNEFDLQKASSDGRTDPGSDILIHGTNGSIGCIAVGDQASEDLFVLVNDTKTKPVMLIAAPVDLRERKPPAPPTSDPSWLPELYDGLKKAMSEYPEPDNDR